MRTEIGMDKKSIKAIKGNEEWDNNYAIINVWKALRSTVFVE